MGPTESAIRDFCEVYSCKNVIKDNTSFRNPLKLSCIDLMITNRPKSFQNSATVETGLSDFHKMTLTVMKVFYKKQKPNIVTYRNYKHFSNEAFMFDVKNSIIQMTSERNNLEFDRFKTALDKAIQRHAPIKKRYVRANQAPFINKKINKEIMKMSRLRNKFLNTKNDIDRKAYNKQRNLCESLIRSEKKNFFSNIDASAITDSKTLWKMVKPFFTDKTKTKSRTTPSKKIVSQEDQEEIASQNMITEVQAAVEVFNKFFVNIVPNLKTSTDCGIDNDFIATGNQVTNTVNKFRNHSSIIMIKKKKDKIFCFSPVTYDNVLKKQTLLTLKKPLRNLILQLKF